MAIVHFHIIPNAKTYQVVGTHRDAIKIRLRAPAVDGKANAALLNFLAEQLEISKHAIVLERGQKSREKLIRIEGLSEIETHRRLGIQQPAGPGC
jgi:uncharacterized protein (TIGR00251 family)